MIRLKTAVLLGFSLKLGALLAEAEVAEAERLYELGLSIGMGFQLKDDLLDIYADQARFGKQVGRDIIANKKTFLLLKALELANDAQKTRLDQWLATKTFDEAEKIAAVTAIYDEIGIRELTLEKIDHWFEKGFEALAGLGVTSERKAALIDFTKYLINRDK